ncbi:MAG: hypothetical protein RIR53_587, partial [Bacteroidota bacterium]
MPMFECLALEPFPIIRVCDADQRLRSLTDGSTM